VRKERWIGAKGSWKGAWSEQEGVSLAGGGRGWGGCMGGGGGGGLSGKGDRV